jgi:mono/diheme cytochrome c family protein
MRRAVALASLLLWLGSITACRRQEMEDQPRYKPLERSRFFEDERSARPLPEGTVARGHLRVDREMYLGKRGEQLLERFPFAITRGDLERGRERYDIFCSPCHGRAGTGEGMVVQRGFRPPPSFHLDRLREAPVGHFYDVITNGFGAMWSYASRIPPRDRWAIVAYVRALQLSQNIRAGDLAPEDRRNLEAAK